MIRAHSMYKFWGATRRANMIETNPANKFNNFQKIENNEPDFLAACSVGDVMTVKRVLSHGGINVNCQDPNSKSGPLHKAAASKDARMIKVLLKKGAYIDMIDSLQSTPLHYALSSTTSSANTQKSECECISLLLSATKKKANNQNWSFEETNETRLKNYLHARNIYGQTAFHLAMQKNAVGINQLLIGISAEKEKTPELDANNKNNDNNVPNEAIALNVGPENNSSSIGDGNNVDAIGEKILEKRISEKINQEYESAAMLLAFGCDINTKNSRGDTSLHEACQSGNLAAASFLLSNKKTVKIEMRDRNNETCLIRAVKANQSLIAKLLLESMVSSSAFSPFSSLLNVHVNSRGQNILQIAISDCGIDMFQVLQDYIKAQDLSTWIYLISCSISSANSSVAPSAASNPGGTSSVSSNFSNCLKLCIVQEKRYQFAALCSAMKEALERPTNQTSVITSVLSECNDLHQHHLQQSHQPHLSPASLAMFELDKYKALLSILGLRQMSSAAKSIPSTSILE